MFGLNAMALMVFAFATWMAARLCRRGEPTAVKAVRGISVALLTLNLCRYALFPLTGRGVRIPVEFSTVAYFAVPLILLSSRKALQSWAAYSSLMAGFFYYLTLAAAGGPVYNAYPPFEIYVSMFCHGSLYLCGLILLRTHRYDLREGYILPAGNALVAANALLFRSLAEGTERIFIYELLDGACIRRWLPQSAWPVALPGYYIALVGLVVMSIRWFFRLNRAQYHKYALPREEHTEPIPAQ